MFERLASVTAGGSTRQLLITRSPNVALGFNVRPDGIVTEVVKGGPADTGGLVPGARIMEICTVAVSTLTQVKKCKCNLIQRPRQRTPPIFPTLGGAACVCYT